MDLYRLTEALQIIKSACSEIDNCTICPMGSPDLGCRIRTHHPEDWLIKQPEIPRIME